MIDSHCHLADRQFDIDRDDVVLRAIDAGVEQIIVIADHLPEAERCAELAIQYERVSWTAGVHPHYAQEWSEGDGERLKTMLSAAKKCRAVGEIGLDYHYPSAPLGAGSREDVFYTSPRDVQRAVFREQLLCAKEAKVPAVVHCRQAIADVRSIIEEVDAGPFVLHCCTEAWDDVAWIVDRGSLLSFTGIATFPKSDTIRETIRRCPVSAMMVETDAPYLAPIPYRGKRCEPAYVMEVARCIAAEKGMDIDAFDRQTTETATAFFRLPS